MKYKKKKEYALYKGDEIIAIGTVEKLAEITGTVEKTIRHYGAPAYLKRLEKHKEKCGRRRLIKID